MKKGNLLSRAEMKNVLGGKENICEGKTGEVLSDCRYNVCMTGWDASMHTDQENTNKTDSCSAMSN